jgi:hypothetical protein
MGLVLVGVTTDTTCRPVAIGRPGIARAVGRSMGEPPLPPAEMTIQFLAGLLFTEHKKKLIFSFFS